MKVLATVLIGGFLLAAVAVQAATTDEQMLPPTDPNNGNNPCTPGQNYALTMHSSGSASNTSVINCNDNLLTDPMTGNVSALDGTGTGVGGNIAAVGNITALGTTTSGVLSSGGNITAAGDITARGNIVTNGYVNLGTTAYPCGPASSSGPNTEGAIIYNTSTNSFQGCGYNATDRAWEWGPVGGNIQTATYTGPSAASYGINGTPASCWTNAKVACTWFSFQCPAGQGQVLSCSIINPGSAGSMGDSPSTYAGLPISPLAINGNTCSSTNPAAGYYGDGAFVVVCGWVQ
jgi:hypothetical protein